MVKSILVFLYSCKLWQNSLAAGTMWQCVVKKLEAATREGGGRGDCSPMRKAWSASPERQRGNTGQLCDCLSWCNALWHSLIGPLKSSIQRCTFHALALK